MWNSNLRYNLLQQGAGKYEEGEESEVSSQKKESSQEKTENLEPWSHIFDKAENVLLPVYRKEPRKVLSENLQWMRAMEKDSTFKKVMETQKELKDSEGFDWLESTELAIDKRKFLLNRLYQQPVSYTHLTLPTIYSV